MSAASICVEGDTLHLTLTVENQGNYSESFIVKLTDTTDGIEIGSQSVTLSIAGEGGMNGICDLTLTGETGGNQYFGAWLTVGDVNGDGYDDILVSAAGYNNKQGRVYLYYGGENMDENADITFTGQSAGDEFGDGDMCLADLNNDNFDDVIIGARCFNNSQGRIYIYYGGRRMDANVDITIDGEVIDSRFGHTIVVGDVNGDGYNDLIIGANMYNNYTGRAYLYYGPIASDTTVDKTFTGEGTNDVFSHQMSLADVDGDNCDDLLVGTRFYPDVSTINTGRAYLYYGATGQNMDEDCDLTFDAENADDRFASSIDLFDVDGDKYADVIIGARGWHGNYGRGYIYWGDSDRPMNGDCDLYLNGELGAHMGGDSVQGGYVNNDKYGDIIFMGWGYNGGQGRAYLYYGNTQASMDPTCDHTFTGEVPGIQPFRVRIADFNGDDYGDVVMGAGKYNNSQGRVWLYYNEPPSSIDVNFDWDTIKASTGEHILKAEIVPVTGEKDTADNTKTITVNVKSKVKEK